jgi:hypothetical protein
MSGIALSVRQRVNKQYEDADGHNVQDYEPERANFDPTRILAASCHRPGGNEWPIRD